ncbi:hypothetical protein GRI39_01050 [Altererythrobacter indicus]|uniref:Uncharacterized protein n=1 Tax=Altericroceibacterium indicum TaxID=374177 RepID=A0A845A4H3_9SPHN|nr:hypothetical protein [Altericroceibacterium indicum]MXP24634.1 hypothetical protein [Altericroceibacterium indicum]
MGLESFLSQSENDFEHRLRNLEQENQILQRWLARAVESLQSAIETSPEEERLAQIEALHASLLSLQDATNAKHGHQPSSEK